jgi:hypothetical protein
MFHLHALAFRLTEAQGFPQHPILLLTFGGSGMAKGIGVTGLLLRYLTSSFIGRYNFRNWVLRLFCIHGLALLHYFRHTPVMQAD